jgi:hypothetical protein
LIANSGSDPDFVEDNVGTGSVVEEKPYEYRRVISFQEAR